MAFKVARIQEGRWGEKGKRSISGVTVNRALATLRLIFNYAERSGYAIPNPVKGVEFFKEPKHLRTISLEEEVAYLAKAGWDKAPIYSLRSPAHLRLPRGNGRCGPANSGRSLGPHEHPNDDAVRTSSGGA